LFEIIEALSCDPMKLFAYPWLNFRPGLIAQFDTFKDYTVGSISNGDRPIGLIANRVLNDSENISLKHIVHVYYNRCIFKTNIYDTKGAYNTGTGLYVKHNGLLTSQKTNSMPVARVITGPTKFCKHFEALWL